MAERATYVPRPNRGDQRREQLLVALEALLAEKPLADIGIAEISRAAGVTRSGFYFYFPTKAAAVAALLADFREQMQRAGAAWYEGGDGTPRERVEATVGASVALWREHAGLLVAMLDAIGSDAEVRQIWEDWSDAFAERIAERIVIERETGVSRTKSEPAALARALYGATQYAMERDVRAVARGEAPSGASGDALIELWHRTLYATS
jgi:TetR/AcrR family transcriptional regulator, ethionamide resistance regulator